MGIQILHIRKEKKKNQRNQTQPTCQKSTLQIIKQNYCSCAIMVLDKLVNVIVRGITAPKYKTKAFFSDWFI